MTQEFTKFNYNALKSLFLTKSVKGLFNGKIQEEVQLQSIYNYQLKNCEQKTSDTALNY